MKSEYQQYLDDYMNEIIQNSSTYVRSNFENLGWNLIARLSSKLSNEDHLNRECKSEAINLRIDYQMLVTLVDKIKQTTSDEI